MAVAAYVAVAWAASAASPMLRASALALLLASLVYTAASAWYTHLARRVPGLLFLSGQIAWDLALVTGLVWLTGGSDSAFAPLYLLVICAAALVLPFRGTLLTGVVASVLFAIAAFGSDPDAAGTGVAIRIGLFAAVALVNGYLGQRLRQTGTALGEVAGELHRLRLDTDDILGSINTGILSVDARGRLAYINPSAAELLALNPEDWLGRPVLKTLDGIAPGLGSVIARSAADGKSIGRYETEPVRDTALVLGVSTTVMERSHPTDTPVTAIFQDITERKRMEALHLRAERLEAVAELSASLAHEIKNPLASIRSAVEQLADVRVDPEDRRLLSGLVLRESDRLSRLLAEFIDFARVEMLDPAPVDLSVLAQDVIAVARVNPDASAREVQIETAGELPPLQVRGSEDLLYRALLNLVLNAVQWAGEGGRVTIALDLLRSDVLSPALGTTDIARLVVSDTGPGVPPEHAEHIFDPFFTRRPGGTGLGLALVHRVVEAHGGAIFVDDHATAETQGAVFTLYLPLLSAAAPLPSPEMEAALP